MTGMKNCFYLLGALILGGCATAPDGMQATGKKRDYRPSAYQRAGSGSGVVFGEWKVGSDCAVWAETGDFTIQTNGLIYKGGLRLELEFPAGTVGTPMVQITGKQDHLDIKGRGTHYTVMLPYSADGAMYLMQNGIYLSVTYRNATGSGVLENNLATEGLPSAVQRRTDICS